VLGRFKTKQNKKKTKKLGFGFYKNMKQHNRFQHW